ncbi:hypothetical protein [Methanopyrus sp. KOL6]|uniref:hypothetical protein n=1 Tax=Methanopyrus sp. KOL6 TaxID=1937004 RepID=UPI000B4B0E9E|nr:hypothetical protein [Methanopyrus sp. KOL6]
MRWKVAAALVTILVLSPALVHGSFDHRFQKYLCMERLQSAVNDIDGATKCVATVLASSPYLAYKVVLYDNTLRVGNNPGRDRLELLSAIRSAERKLELARLKIRKARAKGVTGLDRAERNVSRVLSALRRAENRVKKRAPGAMDDLREVEALTPVLRTLTERKWWLVQEITSKLPKFKYYELSENLLYLPPFNILFPLVGAFGP